MPQERISKDYFLNPLRAQKFRITMNPTSLTGSGGGGGERRQQEQQ